LRAPSFFQKLAPIFARLNALPARNATHSVAGGAFGGFLSWAGHFCWPLAIAGEFGLQLLSGFFVCQFSVKVKKCNLENCEKNF